MADATLPTAGTHSPGHSPFWLRAHHAMREPSRIVSIVAVDDGLVTVVDGESTEQLWTHPPAARPLALALERGPLQLTRFGGDVFISNGYPFSLVDPSQASQCADPDNCGHVRAFSARTGEPWQIEDTLALQNSAEEA